ncbi:putative permease [Halobacteroides halobius DSM 5150]|uniref:Putative permease n=1 Tax=Halobacteroides halobius (strain ATCC 35273 / DSM 5150 / MD-1) TaxID=748449 RepID=L0K5Q5_HALHC|nr:AEC family transporter [Halobacteroides halobius]AGB40326.1 putative permease [Halobacteroides halobius DSM 5150]
MIIINFIMVFNQTLVLFLLLMVGFTIRRLEIVDDSLKQNLTNLIIYVTLPALLIDSMSYQFSLERLTQLGSVFINAVLVYLLMIIISYIVIHFLSVEQRFKDVYQFILIFGNVGFMGYPVIEVVYGSTEGIFLAAIYNLVFHLVLWTLGIMIMSRSQENGQNLSLQGLLNPGVISITVGFLLFIFSIELPKPITYSLEMLGETTTPLSMIVVGSILAQVQIKDIIYNSKLWLITLIRLLILPLTTLLILQNFNLDRLILGVVVILTAMPAAANTAIFAQEFGGDEALASEGVFLTTLLSIFTIPLIVYLL